MRRLFGMEKPGVSLIAPPRRRRAAAPRSAWKPATVRPRCEPVSALSRCSRCAAPSGRCAESGPRTGGAEAIGSRYEPAPLAPNFRQPQGPHMNDAHIIGWGHTPFGKLDALDMEQLIRDAALPAVASAGLELS